MSLKEKIIAESKRLGIDKIGFASAEPFYELESSLREQRAKGHTSGFEHQVIEERIYPEEPLKIRKQSLRSLWHIRQKSKRKCREMRNGGCLPAPLGGSITMIFYVIA